MNNITVTQKQKILFYFYLLVLCLPNVILSTTEAMCFAGRICLIILPMSVYWILLSLGRRPSRMVLALFPILFLGAFQMVLTYLFGQGPIAVDMWLNLTTTNSGEAGELLSQLLPAVIGVVIVYIPTIIIAFWSSFKMPKIDDLFIRKQRKWATILAAVSVLATSATTIFDKKFDIRNNIFPLNSMYNLYLATIRQNNVLQYKKTSANFKFDAVAEKQDSTPQVVVFVIGETSRTDNWQILGYKRPTNPHLSKIENLTIFTNNLSQSNTTHKSVPILLSLATAENYDTLYSSKGIIAAYKEAGYKTCFYSNQARNNSFIDFLGEEADDCIFLRDHNKTPQTDDALLPLIKAKIANNKGRLFIVLHTYGSHFDYNDRYKAEDAFFKPDRIESAKPKWRKQLINAYDNTIRSTDKLLYNIISMLQSTKSPAVMLFTPDHGEDIFDDSRKRFLHASPIPTLYQLRVPILVWSSKEYEKENSEKMQNLRSHCNKSTGSDCIFHTLLGIGGIETKYRNDSLSLVSRKFTEKPQHYISDHNKAVTPPTE